MYSDTIMRNLCIVYILYMHIQKKGKPHLTTMEQNVWIANVIVLNISFLSSCLMLQVNITIVTYSFLLFPTTWPREIRTPISSASKAILRAADANLSSPAVKKTQLFRVYRGWNPTQLERDDCINQMFFLKFLRIVIFWIAYNDIYDPCFYWSLRALSGSMYLFLG